jgi:hypothetical protein
VVIPSEKLAALRSNIFEPAHTAISDWHSFPWHQDKRGDVQADKVQSSQALATDVFGTIKDIATVSQTAVLDALAVAAGLPQGGPWQVELEWSDPKNLLCEKRRTQVDAIAFGRHSIMVIECKFTETGGACSQTGRIAAGTGMGSRQCNGRYEMQTHPGTGVAASCTLSGKGIRYWDVIPQLFKLDPAASYDPCPFKGEAFQWMRNMALASELGRDQGKAAACIIAFAEGGGFPTEAKAGSTSWLPELADSALAPFMISYQQIARLATEADDSPIWPALGKWIKSKVARVRLEGGEQKR